MVRGSILSIGGSILWAGITENVEYQHSSLSLLLPDNGYNISSCHILLPLRFPLHDALCTLELWVIVNLSLLTLFLSGILPCVFLKIVYLFSLHLDGYFPFLFTSPNFLSPLFPSPTHPFSISVHKGTGLPWVSRKHGVSSCSYTKHPLLYSGLAG